MRPMKYWLRGLVCAACLVSVPAMAQLRDISIPISSLSFGTAAIRIAKELGLFEKHGLNAKIIVMDNANSATTALISKSVEVVLSGPGELVAAQGRGQKVVAIANTYNGLSASLVLAKDVAEKTGVSPNAPVAERLKALNGLIIGSTSATSSYTVSFKGAAEAVGANIRFTYMAQPAMVAALEKGAIQGFIAGAPFWGVPVVRDKAVLWLSGPKAELPPQNLPASSVSLQTMQDFAAANPELMKSLAAVIADLGKAIEERPAEVKAAVAKLYPDVDAKTLDLLYASEAAAWKARPLTAADMAHEIAFVKSTGTSLPQIDSVDPASMLVK
ncbi:ABC transporter substrate-binding protein [Chelatococcus asaccharovorans]|uniref:ABC-type nitrate/sulfonate/bicarbonate transport system substrate-binding protein n=1 Tax=Chelatococcus asaccharovorans TaxID=28210 RepID=A0A2V3U1L0_9HYPH|nr:ABC transporter substrate-binding protein [Chelatococcus asaccharovorans]MBS7706894.1 ABC transporter substrate-binding protein [Chelatococcus asaccharovorans]PXW50567.1 ABC-type nitrate/sulfonate/bicarbonate transport system substrate-binding protein [Chelatococcus asaccharovorans]